MINKWMQTSICITINLNLKNKSCQANIYRFEQWLSHFVNKYKQTKCRIGIKKVGDMQYELYDQVLEETNQAISEDINFNKLFTRLGLQLPYYWGKLYKISISSNYKEMENN